LIAPLARRACRQIFRSNPMSQIQNPKLKKGTLIYNPVAGRRPAKREREVRHAAEVLRQYLEANPALEEEWRLTHKLKNDPRVTRLGRLLRRASLDELPQALNVLRGEMSLVGPRPIVTQEVERYGEDFALYCRVKPGITGLWQISGRNNTSYAERVTLDQYYVRNWSIWLDLYVLMKTVRTVLTGDGAY